MTQPDDHMPIRPIQIAAAALTAVAGVCVGRPVLGALIAGYAFTLVDGSSGRPEGRYAPRFHALVARVAWARLLSPWADLALDDEAACRAVAGRQVILACHPHGVMSYCHALLYAHPTALALFPPIRVDPKYASCASFKRTFSFSRNAFEGSRVR